MLFPWLFVVGADEQLVVQRLGRRWVVNGPRSYMAPALARARRRKAVSLGPTEYVRVRDTLSGELRVVAGPTLLFLGPFDEVASRLELRQLEANEYIKIIDKQTGVIRVVRGEGSAMLGPTEEYLDDVNEGINIDEHNAVVVRDLRDGQLELITDHQVFIPGPQQEIQEVRSRVLLEDHEVVVIKDRVGHYTFRYGSGPERAFFLDPFSTLVMFRWSSGIHKDSRNLYITHIDLRPKFMWYAFQARTQDNVEIMIDITFFWQILDIEAMARTTDDVPGDICAHARSAIIQAVSRVTLDHFLAQFNEIIKQAVLVPEDLFYAERGSVIHAVEVRSITCKDPNTQRILQEIIQETTNRMNRLQKQISENEVQLQQIQGEIDAERSRLELVGLRRERAQAEAEIVGASEAQRVRTYLDLLGPLSEEQKLAIFQLLRKQEILGQLSAGSAQLFFTPSDVDLSIDVKRG